MYCWRPDCYCAAPFAGSSSVAVAKTVTYGQVGDQSWSATQPVRARSKGRTTHPATTEDHVTILNGPRTTTPAQFVHKIRTAPQRETTLRFKMATAPQRQPTLFTKFAPRHNGRPRYDPKLSPRHTRTLNHNVLLAQRE